MKLFIPWRLFFNAYSRQPATEWQTWLKHFRFDDSGVFLIRDVVLTEPKNPRKKFLSELEQAVLVRDCRAEAAQGFALMPPELAVKAITHTVIAIQIITILLVLLIALRKEIEGGDTVRGIVHFGIAVMALCTFLALMVALSSAKKMAIREKLSQRFETANWNPHL